MSKPKKAHRQAWQAVGDFVENAVTNNIVLFQGMGLCPVIAAGVSLKNGVVLTVCTAVVMLPLSMLLSLLGNRLPKWLRPVAYVLLASLLLVGAAYLLETRISPELYAKLYLFIPLMAVNLLYTRSMDFVVRAPILETTMDALGSTVGFGVVICLISALREMAISNTLWDIPLHFTVDLPEAASPFSAFILLGFLSALLQWSRPRVSAYFRKKEEEMT